MNNQIYKLVSDSNTLDDMSEGFRNRNLEQKFLYTEEGADFFYGEEKNGEKFNKFDIISNENYLKVLEESAFNKSEKVVFISLACGNSYKEKEILEELFRKGYDITYIGVDFSEKMLSMSIESLKNINIEKKFILADFSSKKFKDELEYLTQGYDQRVFTFYGNTFGNLNHTNIIDILSGILKKGEKLLIEVVLRNDLSVVENMNIFNRNKNQLDNPLYTKFILNKLEQLGVDLNNGELLVNMIEEKGINALKIKFIFEFTKKTEIDFRGNIVFLPGEKVNLYTIYYYCPNNLKSFCKEHHFKFLNGTNAKKWGQFLFEKE